MKEKWKKVHGTDDENKVREILKNLTSELSKSQERLNNLYNKLLECCDWDALEEELS